MSIWAIYAFANVIRILLNPEFQEQSRRTLLKERTRTLVLDSAKERVGNNILLQKLGPDGNIKIQYTVSRSWIQGGSDTYIFVDLPQAGWIADVNIRELELLSRLIEDGARKLGFELYERAAAAPGVATSGPELRSSPLNVPAIVKKAYLLKRFREELPPESIFSADGRAILALPREFAKDASLLAEIGHRVSYIFKSTNDEPSSVAFRREMQATKDQLVRAIRSLALGAVEELRKTYLQVSEEFLETLHELGGSYSADQARRERGNLFEGWNEIRWLVRDIRELIIVSTDTDNLDVIRSISFLSTAAAARSIQAHDHLLFQEFLPFATFLYQLGSSKPANSDVREFLTHRSWRQLVDIVNLYLVPSFTEQADTKRDFGEVRGFALFVLKVFQELMKASFHENDISAFKVMIKEFRHLFERATLEDAYPNSQIMESRLKHMQDDEAGRLRLQEQLGRQRKKEDVSQCIALAREQVLFGLASHMLDKLFVAPSDPNLKQFFLEVQSALTADLDQLTKIFVSTEEHAISDYWGWSFWDSVADGRPHFVDMHTKRNRLYCVRALQLLALLKPEAIGHVKLLGLSYLAVEGNPSGLPVMLQNIDSQSEQWLAVLSQAELGKVSLLLELLNKARIADAHSEQAAVIAAEIDPGKIAEFRTNLLNAFKTRGRLRPLMEAFHIIEDLSDGDPAPGVLSFGFNQLEAKGAFIVQSRVSYGAWGEGYGRGLAQAEDGIAFDKMISNAAIHDPVRLNELISAIERHLLASKMKSPLVIQSLSAELEYAGINQADLFKPRYRRECPSTSLNDLRGFKGVLKVNGQVVPVFELFLQQDKLRNKVLLVDLYRYVRWSQLSPIEEASDEANRLSMLIVRVVDLNKDDDRRDRIISENPEWLREKEDPEEFLRSNVVVNVFEKFKVEIFDRDAGICICVDDDNG